MTSFDVESVYLSDGRRVVFERMDLSRPLIELCTDHDIDNNTVSGMYLPCLRIILNTLHTAR